MIRFLFALLSPGFLMMLGSCNQKCDGAYPPNVQVVISVVNKNTQRALIRYPGNGTVPDTIRLVDMETGRRLSIYSGGPGSDSLLFAGDFLFIDGKKQNLKLSIGSLKPDTLSFDVKREEVSDCTDGYAYYRPLNIKLNNVTVCTDCRTDIVRIEK